MDPLLRHIEAINPVTLVDVLLATPLRRRANLIVLQPHGEQYRVVVKRGSATLAEFTLPAEVGHAAVARLAVLADLDPFGTPSDGKHRPGVEPAARIRVRAGKEEGEILVSIEATPRGFEAELRPLTVNGESMEQRRRSAMKRCVRCGAHAGQEASRCELDGGELLDVDDDPRPGGTISVYRVLATLGDGGMGTVLAAVHVVLGRPVAIKVPHASIVENPEIVRMFLTEARAASRVRHPNLLDVTDYGLMSDGRPYMVMERLEGESLRDRLEREGTLSPLTALLIAREVALGLGAAHEGGVVHRDLKPDNMLLLGASHDDAPRLKLVDFGAATRPGEALGDDELILGTPAYMAPEHSRGEPTDGRADLYSLGIVLFEMLSGTLPYQGENDTATRLAHMTQPLPPLKVPGEPLPDPVLRVVQRALRKRAEERYQNADEMVVDLDKALAAQKRRDWRRWLPL